MENNELLEITKNCIKIFCKQNCLNYIFNKNEIEFNNSFKEKSYVSLQQYWSNWDIGLIFKFDLVHYSNGSFYAFVFIYKYINNTLNRHFSLDGYLMYNHLKMPELEECAGESIKDKIICYLDNVKEIILPILKGEVWLDSPTYWENYK